MLRLRNVLATLCLVVACACQSLFGDFEITSAPAEEPASVLGTACEPGDYRCTNELLETCSDDRSGFVVAEVCQSPAECNLNARTCRPCDPGELMCRGNVLERCDASAWVVVDTCDSPALCSVAPDHMTGSCTDALCVAGSHRCEGALLVRCTEGRDDWQDVALCENPELCDAAYADEVAEASGTRGACRPAACEPDEFRCNGAALEHCAFDRKSFVGQATCDSPDLCNVTLGACAACEPGVLECNGAELRRCKAAGGWETLDQCASAALCSDETGSCDDPECSAPGSLRCGSGNLLEVCSDGLSWEVIAACATRELCSASSGRCLTPACDEDATRCQGDRHERCSSDRSRWELVATCPAGAYCDADQGCVDGPCSEGTTRCNGPSLERCTEGAFAEIAHCETEALCDAAAVPPTCKPPECSDPYECMNGIIRRCRPGRDGLDEVLTCPSGTTCDVRPDPVTGQPECDACPANEYTCSGNELFRCSSDGKRRERVATCSLPCDAATVPPTCIQMP